MKHINLKKDGVENQQVLIKDIAKEANKERDDNDKLTPQMVGRVLKSKLFLSTHKTTPGMVFNYDEHSDVLESLSKRYRSL